MSHCKQTSIISTSLKIIVVMLGLLGQALTIVNAATACTEAQISDYSYPSNANETLNDTCAINFGPNIFISSGAQLSVTAPVIRLLAGTTIAHAATVRFKAEENVIQGGINQAILGPLAGSEITAYRLNDLYNSIAAPFQADNSLDNLQIAGTFRLPLAGIADDDWILVTATGGQDIDADDDGQLDAQPTTNQGTLHAIATAADWRAGGVNINILSELAWQYTRSLIGQVSDDELPIRLNQLAKLWIKQDLNADGEIDWRDLLSFKSGDAGQQAKLNFN